MRLIESINLRYIRRIEDLTLNFTAGINVIIGPNGTCKTTVLKMIMFSIFDRRDHYYFLKNNNEGYIRADHEQGIVKVKIRNLDDYYLDEDSQYLSKENISKFPIICFSFSFLHGNEFQSIQSLNDPDLGTRQGTQSTLIGAYGSQRSHHKTMLFQNSKFELLMNEDLFKKNKKQKAAIMFGSTFGYPQIFLRPEVYISRLERDIKVLWDKMSKDILRLFEFPTGWSIQLYNEKVEIFNEEGRRQFSFHDLSDGQKSISFIVMDILFNAVDVGNMRPDFIVEGIVLIDEIETHFHPHFQAKVVDFLKNAFPGIQFIITTHSPHVVINTSYDQLISLDLDESGKVFRKTVETNKPKDLASVISSSEFFDAPLYSLAQTAKIKEYCRIADRLLNGVDLSDEEEGKLISLSIDLLETDHISLKDPRLDIVLTTLAEKHRISR